MHLKLEQSLLVVKSTKHPREHNSAESKPCCKQGTFMSEKSTLDLENTHKQSCSLQKPSPKYLLQTLFTSM